MNCHYYQAGVCRSCTLIQTPYSQQLASKQEKAQQLLAPWPSVSWHPPVASAQEDFRNKAKLVVTGSSQQPKLGILGPKFEGQDLRDCPLYTPKIRQAIPVLEELIRRAKLTPYSVAQKKGELKNILVTSSDRGQLMVRFVLRSKKLLVAIRSQLDWLQGQLPQLEVVSINLLREHVALVEGPEEIILTQAKTLPMQVGGLTLHLRPQSFFQTNTAIASALYQRGASWVKQAAPASLWDLYCGVGGFALFAAQQLGPDSRVTGIEISTEAIASAQRTVAEAGLSGIDFIAQDATSYALESGQVPQMLVMNPPRRGIGQQLAQWVETSGIEQVVYSSCNVESFVKDLAAMPSYRPVEGQVMDMFPHSSHFEAIFRLERI